MKLEFRQRLLSSTLLVGASMVATPALAAQPLPDPAQDDPPETIAPLEGTTVPLDATGQPIQAARDIVVTGTRIPQPNLESASPITVVTSQEVKLSGTTRTEDLINSLPQVFAAQGSNISNGASGTATVQLRGIGSNRTMVLVNGRRLHAGDTGNPVPDINFIPSAMIKRVDMLTGGASSVYGADAVAGVVNFILDTTFTGFRIDGQASVFNHKNRAAEGIIAANEAQGFQPPRGWSTNGGAQDITGVMGASFDDGRGHVTAYAAYRSQDPVLQASRDYSFCALSAVRAPLAESLGRNFNCAGSLTNALGTFLHYDPVTFANIGFLTVGGAGGNEFVDDPAPFNFNPYNYFQRPNERYNLGAFADYEIAPAFRPYLEVMFMDNKTDAVIAPSGNFFATNVIACDNALLSEQQRQQLCAPRTLMRPNPMDPDGPLIPIPNSDPTFIDFLNGQQVQQAFAYIGRRNVEGGGRQDIVNHSAFRVVGGMRGDIAMGMSYDAYYQRGRTNRNSRYENDFSITRLGRAIDVIAVLDGQQVAPGTPGAELVCRAAFTGIDPNCVPWNIFRAGGVDQASLDYLQTPGFQQGQIDQTIAHVDFTLTGDDYGWRLPWAESGIGFNFGAEYRKETLDLAVDEAFRTGDLAGQGGPTPPVSGEFDVRELFAEAQLPIIQNSFISEFIVRAGYRYSDYSVGGGNSFSTDTYKIEGELAPVPDIRFRGSYNRAVRAPNIVELFFPTSLGLSGTVDPCAGPAPAATLAQCQLTGVTAAQYGNIVPSPADQYNAQFGGNPDLTPERADTYTLGVVFQPRFVPGLALTADYWNIKIKNMISLPEFGTTFDDCFAGDATACARINRAPGTGSLWLGQEGFIVLTNQNFEGLGIATSGFDFQGNYSRRLGGMGTLNASFVGTLLSKLNDTSGNAAPPGGFAGLTPSPKWRHQARVGLTMPNGLGASVRWRHFSGVDCDWETQIQCAQVFQGVRYPRPGNERLSAQDYFDLAFNARLAQRLNLRLGANNIFDRDPPLAGGEAIPAGFGNGNTYPQVYDALGRFLFAGFTVDF